MKNKLLKKSIRKYRNRNRMKLNRTKYSFRDIQEMYFVPIYKNVGRKCNLYTLKYKDRVFHRNMVDGLCFNKFYGRDKIIFKRDSFKRKRLRKY